MFWPSLKKMNAIAMVEGCEVGEKLRWTTNCISPTKNQGKFSSNAIWRKPFRAALSA